MASVRASRLAWLAALAAAAAPAVAAPAVAEEPPREKSTPDCMEGYNYDVRLGTCVPLPRPPAAQSPGGRTEPVSPGAPQPKG